VHGGAVTCPLHCMVISLETGHPMGADDGQVRTFRLQIDGETILIDTASLETLAA
jgi:nitrite reductase (NADH) small subunit